MGMRFGVLLLLSVLLALGLRCQCFQQHSQDKPASLSPESLETLASSDGFDFPIGGRDAEGYYNAQVFQSNQHLGEDWNGNNGGDTDLGDPVRAVADGVVLMAGDAGPGWGNVVRLVHNAGTTSNPKLVESLYGHLDTMAVTKGQVVRRGTRIGSIGTANGKYIAHLHLEMRDTLGLPIGPGYSNDTRGYIHPSEFIQANRATTEPSPDR